MVSKLCYGDLLQACGLEVAIFEHTTHRWPKKQDRGKKQENGRLQSISDAVTRSRNGCEPNMRELKQMGMNNNACTSLECHRQSLEKQIACCGHLEAKYDDASSSRLQHERTVGTD